jgi:molybdate transport system ATP-binding protein
MPQKIIELNQLAIKLGGLDILTGINLTIHENEQWALVGKTGSGKTSLAKAIAGQSFFTGTCSINHRGSIEWVEQQHRFRTLSNTQDFYYQQRFQSQDADDSMTIEEELKEHLEKNPGATGYWLETLHLKNLLKEPLIQLSNGENKRIQLIKALLNKPSVLILDSPFIGLDHEGRQTLHRIVNSIVENGIQIILITSPNEIPSCITHVAELEKGSLKFSGEKKDFLSRQNYAKETGIITKNEVQSLAPTEEHDFEKAVRMVNVSIRYGDRTILDHISWEIKKGECWGLSGPNGAGKSTLLSLINADNPQAYANEIYLFDKRRGRGESIWDIKKKIGFVSPERHLYFPFSTSCYHAIASGLFDTIGLFRTLTEQQDLLVKQWMHLLQLDLVSNKPLQLLSAGEQRMCLLARALVKNPPLLVLDEPCQGLDEEHIRYFNAIVNRLCTEFGTTLIYVSHYREQFPSCVNKFLHIESGGTIREA